MSDHPPPVLLPSIDAPEGGDHPEELTAEEAERGHRAYLAVDDTDDDSTGIEAL